MSAIPDSKALGQVGAALPAATGARTQTQAPDVAFRALLERLEREAQALDRQVQQVGDAEGLAQAVDRAHASLQDALSLGDQLLEAFRKAAIAGPADAKPGS